MFKRTASFSSCVSFHIIISQFKVITCFMVFQQLIYQQGFFALRSNNAEIDKKARRSRLTQYLLQQKISFKKKQS